MAHLAVDVALDVARQLVTQSTFDPEVAAGLLASMSLDGLDAQRTGAITFAKRVNINAIGGSTVRIDEARFALAHVVSLFEAQTADLKIN